MSSEEAVRSTFQNIGKGVYLSPSLVHKPQVASTGDGSPPTLILIFGWMGAKLPHLLKYTKVYEELYPSATKLLIQCHPSFFWSRESTRRAQLGPVVEVLQALGHLPPTSKTNTDIPQIKLIQPRLLIHAFSNGMPFSRLRFVSKSENTRQGGCSQLICLSRLLAARYADRSLIQPSTCTIVFDSCPGLGNMQHAKNAFGTLTRNWLIRRLMNVVITWLFFYSAVVRRLFGWKNAIEELKIALHSPRLLPWVHKGTPRLYLYSKTDEMVPFYEVDRHAEEARGAGLNVQTQVFEDTPHVCHAKIEPEKYWSAVTNLWRGADAAVQKNDA
ncbi:hypothetical protein DXG03_001254 [Asterophora parasitica]|uniref:Indole-diterpene biosynthesis protein PaxU n=1 Tax=Asterophora parasitica TaxID=117018 RepID=A0A9P7GA52_9AGAR|nr:hypothetical protein DXG03_001254 [Asterophora parasitica]